MSKQNNNNNNNQGKLMKAVQKDVVKLNIQKMHVVSEQVSLYLIYKGGANFCIVII